MRSRPFCQPPHDSTLCNPCEITEIRRDWLTPTPSSFFPFLPPLHPISQGFWTETCKEDKANLDTAEIYLGSRNASGFATVSAGEEKTEEPQKSWPRRNEEMWVFYWERRSLHKEEGTCPKPHKCCLMLLLHKTDYNFHLFPWRHLWFSSKNSR